MAAELKDRTLVRSVKAFLAAREGDFTHAIPKLKAAEDIVLRYLRNKAGELTPANALQYIMKKAALAA